MSIITKDSEKLKNDEILVICEIIAKLLKSQDHDTLLDALLSLVNLSSVSKIIQILLDKNLIYFTIQILCWDSLKIKSFALKTLGNVCGNTYEQTQYVINFDILNILFDNAYIYSCLSKDTFWVLSNIAAGTPNQVALLINSSIFKNAVVSLVHYDFDTRIQVSQMIINLLSVS